MTERSTTRREFLRAAARWTLLTLGTSLIGALAARRGAACDRVAFCRDCALLNACPLPQAQKAKEPSSQRKTPKS